jgi:hypothetical protein
MIMANEKVNIDPRFMTYNKDEVQHLLDEVHDRSFFRDVTEDEYESLSQEDKMNGDLYLLHDPEEV